MLPGVLIKCLLVSYTQNVFSGCSHNSVLPKNSALSTLHFQLCTPQKKPKKKNPKNPKKPKKTHKNLQKPHTLNFALYVLYLNFVKKPKKNPKTTYLYS